MTHADPFLSEKRYCDHSHPSLRRLADTFRSDYPNARELAVAVFLHVRDTIAYEVGNWQRPASATLARRHGTCTNSANLMVALLRGAGIPAGYGVMSVRGREYFGPLAPARLSRLASETSTHVYACVRLDGNWLRCDPSDDVALSLGTCHLNPQSRLMDWDGRSDAMLDLNPDHVLRDEAPLADIGRLMNKPMRAKLRIPVRIANHFMDFCRQEGPRLRSPADAEEEFLRWYRSRHPGYYRIYRALPSPILEPGPTTP